MNSPSNELQHGFANDLRDKAVIITGGTAGIGLACGLAFAQQGAKVYLTHRWGSADEDQLRALFAKAGATEPQIVEADASLQEDTDALMQRVQSEHERVEVIINNVSFAQVCPDFHQLARKDLRRSLKYSAWPFVGYLQSAKRIFGHYPRYHIGMSSRGPEYFLPGYEFVATSKTVMETYCKYLSRDLAKEDVRINVIRANPVQTQSLEATFGPDFVPFCRHYYGEKFFVQPEEVAASALGLCSGWMDGIRGQILLLDHGCAFADNVVRLFSARERFNLPFPQAKAEGHSGE